MGKSCEGKQLKRQLKKNEWKQKINRKTELLEKSKKPVLETLADTLLPTLPSIPAIAAAFPESTISSHDNSTPKSTTSSVSDPTKKVNNSVTRKQSSRFKGNILQLEKKRLATVYAFEGYRKAPLTALSQHLINVNKKNNAAQSDA